MTITVISYIESTPDGVLFGRKLVGYSSLIRQLNAGNFDAPLSEGFGIVAELALAENLAYFTPSAEQRVIVWRWMVAAVFIMEQIEARGVFDVQNEEGGIDKSAVYCGEYGAITVYPSVERFSLANHIEETTIIKYGLALGTDLAIQFYQAMVEANPDKEGYRLSTMGRESFAQIHDSFIELLHTDGLPDAPAAH